MNKIIKLLGLGLVILGLSACGESSQNITPTTTIEKKPEIIPDKEDKDPDPTPSKEQKVFTDDEVLYSHQRLSNADISFNFDMSNQKYESTNKAELTKLMSEENAVSDLPYVEGTYSDFVDIETYDYFKDMSGYLDNMHNYARDMIDFCVENICYTDVNVIDDIRDNTVYNLHYDSNNDIITLYQKTTNLERKIELYYDEYGDETVHMVEILQEENYITEIIYTPGSNYYIYRGTSYKDELIAATKIRGKWLGLSLSFDPNSIYFTHEGVYDRANGMMGISFLYETNSGTFDYQYSFEFYRSDGGWINPGESYQEGDQFLIELYNIYSNKCSLEDARINVALKLLTNVDKIHLTYIPENVLADDSNYAWLYFNDGSYITFTNGLIFRAEDKWVRGHGVFTYDYETTSYYDKDGNELFSTLGDDYESVSIGMNSGGFLDKPYDASYGVFYFGVNTKNDEARFEILNEFFEEMGITLREDVNFDDLIDLYSKRATFGRQSFKAVLGIDFTIDEILTKCLEIYDEALKYSSDIEEYMSGFETSKLSEIEKIEARAELVKITAKDIKPMVDSDARTINLNGIQVDAAKSIIFRSGATYTILAMANNSPLGFVFSEAIYDSDSLSFTARDEAIDLPMVEGTYSFNLILVRKYSDENGEIKYVPISNNLLINLDNKDEFTYDTEVDEKLGGYYHYSYTIVDNLLVITKEFVDTLAPTLKVGFMEEGKMYFSNMHTLQSVIDKIEVKDNVDFLTIDDVKMYLKDSLEELPRDTLIDHDMDIKISVSDYSSNETCIEVTLVSREPVDISYISFSCGGEDSTATARMLKSYVIDVRYNEYGEKSTIYTYTVWAGDTFINDDDELVLNTTYRLDYEYNGVIKSINVVYIQ